MDEKDYLEGMAGKLIDGKLQWNDKDAWIEVSDLPTKVITVLSELPFYAAVQVCEEFLNDNGDSAINEGYC